MKRFVCIDLEMTEIKDKNQFIYGLRNEIIQIGAVMLDENYNFISEFSSYVKPTYTYITSEIEKLTGISQKMVENADDIITAFDKYNYWVGNENVTTFCWSVSDYNQLWNEIQIKARHREDLKDSLKSFVDLQKVFGNLIKAKTPVSLESAVQFVNEKFHGKAHTATADAYNTAHVLHKICCNRFINPKFEFLYESANPQDELKMTKKQNKSISNESDFINSFASFMPKEILQEFGLDKKKDEKENFHNDVKIFEEKESKKISVFEKIMKFCFSRNKKTVLCRKYGIEISNWLKFHVKIMLSGKMKAA